MTGNGSVGQSAILSPSRARAAVEARRFGVPAAMIEAATRRRLAGDWRGACAAADVDVRLNVGDVRRRHGSKVAEELVADLRNLAPDLLRWHLPRRGHGSGALLDGLLVPLAGYGGQDGPVAALTLAAATTRFSLAAGQHIVLIVVEGDSRRGYDSSDPVSRGVLDSTRRRTSDRFGLLHHRMFWDAAHAALLRRSLDICTADPLAAQAITRLQDAGDVAAAWSAAGIRLADCEEQSGERPESGDDPEGEKLVRWLAAVPVNLPRLAAEVRAVYPSADQAVIRPGGGAIVLSGLDRADGPVCAEVVPARDLRSLPTALPIVPEAAWARPVDVDLLRFGLIRPHALHPLVAAALCREGRESCEGREVREGEAATQPEATWSGSEWTTIPTATSPILVHCGRELHRVERQDGRWHALDHTGEHSARESLLTLLGSPQNACRQTVDDLTRGRHVIDAVERYLDHGRIDEVLRTLRDHAGTSGSPEDITLSGGTTVAEELDVLRERALRLRGMLAGIPLADPHQNLHLTAYRTLSAIRRRSRKGDPARHHR